MTKILITGGAGYIGNILLRELLENQHNKVTVIDNFSYSQHNSFIEIINNNNLNIINQDVRNLDVFNNEIRKNNNNTFGGSSGSSCMRKNKLLATELNLNQIINIKKYIQDQILLVPITNSGYGIGEKINSVMRALLYINITLW